MNRDTINFVIWGILLIGSITLLSPILSPFLMGGLFAYLCNPLVERMNRIPRTLAVSLVFFLLIGGVSIFLLSVIPLLANQLQHLFVQIPVFIKGLESYAWFHHYKPNIPVNAVAEHWQSVGVVVTWLVNAITRSSAALIHHVTNVLLTIVILFYLLRDWQRMIDGAKRLLPQQKARTIINVVRECNDVLAAFFRGQLLVMVLLALFYTTALSLLGLNLSILIGVLTGVLSIVPYLGFIIGIAAASFASFFQFHAWMPVIVTLVIFIVGNGLESFLLIPWLVGDKVGLHPVAVIFAILAGGQLFGFTGLLLALPVAAVVKVLLHRLLIK